MASHSGSFSLHGVGHYRRAGQPNALFVCIDYGLYRGARPSVLLVCLNYQCAKISGGVFGHVPDDYFVVSNALWQHCRPMLFAREYVSKKTWWGIGLMVATFHTVVYLTIGLAFWKWIGY